MQDKETSALSGELLSQLALRGDVRTYARNEVLILEGDVSDALFILVSGQLKIFSQDSRGREVVYNVLNAGEIFGEMFMDGGVRSASVKAMADSQCILVDEVHIRDFIKTYPEFAECLIHSLIPRLRYATQMIKELVLSDVYQRTVTLLNRIALTEGDLRIVPKSITQQDIADRVGATREMINHVMKELTQGGLLARDEERRLVFTKSLPSRWQQESQAPV